LASVSIVMGSESDRELGESARAILVEFGVEHELEVYSAHRSPDVLREYIISSKSSIFIAIAGLSAALPGFIAAHTVKPVIGGLRRRRQRQERGPAGHRDPGPRGLWIAEQAR